MKRLYLDMICFFYIVTAPPEIYTLSLHDALPIYDEFACEQQCDAARTRPGEEQHAVENRAAPSAKARSEEHTSELQSHSDLVCRLLLEKKKRKSSCQSNEHNARCIGSS